MGGTEDRSGVLVTGGAPTTWTGARGDWRQVKWKNNPQLTTLLVDQSIWGLSLVSQGWLRTMGAWEEGNISCNFFAWYKFNLQFLIIVQCCLNTWRYCNLILALSLVLCVPGFLRILQNSLWNYVMLCRNCNAICLYHWLDLKVKWLLLVTIQFMQLLRCKPSWIEADSYLN